MAGQQTLVKNETFLQALSSKIRHKHQIRKSKELEDIKMAWCKAELIHTAIHEICDDQDSPSKISDSLRERLVLADCEQLLEANASSNLLGIETPQMSAAKSEAYLTEVRRVINEKIKAKLLAVSQFYQPSAQTAGSHLVCAKASQLNKLIERDITLLETTKKEIESLQHQRVLQMRKLHQVYNENGRMFKVLLEQYKIGKLPRHESNTICHLTAKTEALAAKIGSIEKEMLAETYKSELVKKLSIVRSNIDASLKETEEKLTCVEKEYQSCLAAGTEFQKIAKDYAQLKNDIEARTWALNELQTAKFHKAV